MIELPEALNLASQINESLTGKCVSGVLPPSKPHKFCWFNGDASDYEEQLVDSTIISAEGFGIFVEINFSNGKKLCINDGVNIRLADYDAKPKNYQLVIEFTDETILIFSVAMYGGIFLHDGFYDNEYYLKSHDYVSPITDDFKKLFDDILNSSKPSLSAKAFLATEQRFPGIGNGVLQDILLVAGIHPKRKIVSLSNEERENLYKCTVSVLKEMIDKGGRDTEKDINGVTGGYITKLSKNTYKYGCPICGGTITKEAYLGGSVYFCEHCQPL